MSGQHITALLPPQTGAAEPDAGAANIDESKNIFGNHKTQLAIGVAATLGILIYYNWQEKNLSKKDPEGYARLQRFKSLVRADSGNGKHRYRQKHHAAVAHK